MSKQTSQVTSPVLTAINQGEYLATSIRTQEAETTNKLHQFHQDLIPTGEGQGMPDWRLNQRTNYLVMLETNEKLLGADLVFRLARADVKAGAAERQPRTHVVQRYYSDLVLMVEGAYGKEYLYVFGLDGRQARNRLAVREQLRDVHGRMTDPLRIALLPSPKPGRQSLDLANIAQGIKTVVDDFEAYIEQQKTRVKALQAASIARNEALKHHRRVYLNIARVQEAWYRLVGLDELADRIRATLPGRRRVEATEPAEPTEIDQARTNGFPCSTRTISST